MSSSTPVIAATGLVKRYGDFTAVDGISFEVAPGESFGLLGPNGAGKSTTMRMLGAVSTRTGGDLRILPHAGRRLDWAPGKFMKSREGLLVCAVHGASFELEGGLCVAGPCRGDALRPVPVDVRDGQVWLAAATGSRTSG